MPVGIGVEVRGDNAVITVLNLDDYAKVATDLVAAAGKAVRTTTAVANGLGFVVPVADADAAGYIDKPKPKRASRSKAASE